MTDLAGITETIPDTKTHVAAIETAWGVDHADCPRRSVDDSCLSIRANGIASSDAGNVHFSARINTIA